MAMTLNTAGLADVATLIGGHYLYLAYGTGTTACAAADTTLEGESQRAAATITYTTTTLTDDTVQWTKTFTIVGTETIAKYGVFDAAAVGTMLGEEKLSSARSVGAGDSWALTAKLKCS
jgi:hypothetical protein